MIKDPWYKSAIVYCLWLLRFYRSPHRDDGCDASDYYDVDPLSRISRCPQARWRGSAVGRHGDRDMLPLAFLAR